MHREPLVSAIALGLLCGRRSRPDDRGHPPGMAEKVRAPQGRRPGNAWATRVDGKCNRKQTADGAGSLVSGKGERVGKSPPRLWQHRRHGKPLRSKTK